MAIQAIETVYKGYRFRSRLEARWAVFFDDLGIAFDYEPQGFKLDGKRYLPDFWLPSQKCWIEVKGEEPTDEEHALAGALAEETGHSVFIFPGPIIVPDDNNTTPPDEINGAYMRCSREGGDHYYCWCECPTCGALGIEFDGRSDRLACKECYRCAFARDYSSSPCPQHPPGAVTGCPRTGGNFDKGYNGASARLVAAYTRARQSRFEHGERP